MVELCVQSTPWYRESDLVGSTQESKEEDKSND